MYLTEDVVLICSERIYLYLDEWGMGDLHRCSSPTMLIIPNIRAGKDTMVR